MVPRSTARRATPGGRDREIWHDLSGQPYSPAQLGEARFLTNGNYYDLAFIGTFNKSLDIARPFLANPSAPADSVGIYASDACQLYNVGCATNAQQLISMNAINASAAAPVLTTNSDVRFIINASRSQALSGTPFGSAKRNSLRTTRTNETNISISKMFLMEGASLEFRLTATNVFNLLSNPSVNPFADLAGDPDGGFSEPASTDATGRRVYIGARFRF